MVNFLFIGVSFIILLSTSLFAQNLTLDFFKDKPKSLTKDFYISQYLDQEISSAQADKIIPQIKNMNNKMLFKVAKKSNNKRIKEKARCLKLKSEKFIYENPECIKIGLSLYDATKLKAKELKQIIKRVKTSYPKLATKYNAVIDKNFTNFINLKPKILISVFNSVGGNFRTKYYNYYLPPTTLDKLSQEPSFSKMVIKIIRDRRLNHIQKSLIHTQSKKLSDHANFLLAINAIKNGYKQEALKFLNISAENAKFRCDHDRALFWKYLLTRDQALLKKIAQSKDINIYSIFANEKLGTTPKEIISSILPKVKNSPIDIKDPFAWIKFYKNFRNKKFASYEEKRAWAMQYNSPDMEPHIAKMIYNYNNNRHYFLKPYYQYIKDLPTRRQVLLLALARQESRFIPTDVSYSYALGMMQFMPFLAKDIAKKLGLKNFKYEYMFDPKIAYIFGNYHLNFLEKHLNHPLFIAYAYNGGLGFTKRKIISKNYFKGKHYEPFWSLEMIPNPQARKYGKKVLANYAIYAKLFGLHITLTELLKELIHPTN